MITVRSHGAPEHPLPTLPMQVFRGRQPSSGAPFWRPHRGDGQGVIATPCRKSRMLAFRVVLASLPCLHKGASIIGHASMIEHKAGHGLVGTLFLGIVQSIAHIVNGAKWDAKALGVILEGLRVHVSSPLFNTHNIGPLALSVKRVFA